MTHEQFEIDIFQRELADLITAAEETLEREDVSRDRVGKFKYFPDFAFSPSYETKDFAPQKFGWSKQAGGALYVLRVAQEIRTQLESCNSTGEKVRLVRALKIGSQLREASDRLHFEWIDGVEAQRRGKKKKGKESPLKQALRLITEEIGTFKHHTVIDHMKKLVPSDSDDTMYDLFESTTNPFPIWIQAVDSDAEMIEFRTRDNKEKTVTFKRIRNILSEISS